MSSGWVIYQSWTPVFRTIPWDNVASQHHLFSWITVSRNERNCRVVIQNARTSECGALKNSRNFFPSNTESIATSCRPHDTSRFQCTDRSTGDYLKTTTKFSLQPSPGFTKCGKTRIEKDIWFSHPMFTMLFERRRRRTRNKGRHMRLRNALHRTQPRKQPKELLSIRSLLIPLNLWGDEPIRRR